MCRRNVKYDRFVAIRCVFFQALNIPKLVFRRGSAGNAEFAGVDNAGVYNSAPCGRDGICRSGQISTMWQGWTLQEWTMRHHVAGMDNAGVDKSARCGKGGHCRSGQCGTMWQGWTMQEWSEVTKAAYKTTSLANDS